MFFCPPRRTAPADPEDDVGRGSTITLGRTPPAAAAAAAEPSPHLRENMTRDQKDRDPHAYYEAIEVLGFGSMGSVTRVRKKTQSVGGSARAHNVDPRARLLDPWLDVPLVGRFLATFLPERHRRRRRRRGGGGGGGAQPRRQQSGRAPISNLDAISESDVGSSPPASARAGRGSFGGGIFRPLTQQPSMRRTLSRQRSDVGYEMHYALKSIHLNRIKSETFVEELRNEIEILKDLDHPHIVRAIETFEHHKQLYMVLELCSGGDLYSRDPYTEEDAARIVRMVLSAVDYMHHKGIVHRDLKYENIMFANNSPQAEIKIIDFGLSKKFFAEQYMKDGVGTIYTMAPEVFKKKYTNKADIWSVGVLAYMLLSSQTPFYANKRRNLVRQILNGQVKFAGKPWRGISQQAKNFVTDLLHVDPDYRPTAQEARQSIWLNRSFANTMRLSQHLDDVHASIEVFANYGKLQKLALMVVAHKSSSEEIGFLRKAFERFDRGSGVISKFEFKSGLADYGYTDEELDVMFHGADIDGTGSINYTEFLASTIEVHGAINEERLAEAFDRLDSDDSGYISAENIRSILGHDIPQVDIEGIIEEAAMDEDNMISYDEFLALFDDQQERKRDEALRQLTHRRIASGSSCTSLSSLWSEECSSLNEPMGQQVVGLSLDAEAAKQLGKETPGQQVIDLSLDAEAAKQLNLLTVPQ